ncbi:hypothetical protein DFJ58DRAFT_719603 [Suillus subalutaceus]|uniref:uncharacterized protein n=1 Tax=Suillus subalutaceus TaxID=48586 RepID=UPI001B885A13|nr:uncharacterized protein DFJ58DRAFT_719603 [Suillus subalutaceus]KAG1830945.1 hypothetical protein DFJ58DRAFT_719603 [Suillus subalutaceus]
MAHKKPSSEERSTYGHAQKMCASMTYAFGRLQGLGNMWWHKSDVGGGIMVGNPSISTEVSSFMCSLQRHKVKAGEVANSAHAITTPGERLSSHRWGGGRARRLLQAAYTLAFVCMLRFDEVLKIQAHDLECLRRGTEVCDMDMLMLIFFVSNYHPDIKPFHLWVFPPHEAHICPVRALTAWLGESRIESGYANTPMASEQFLELFCNNLLDIGIDPAPYGTHSRWALRKIYPPTVKCPHCGRCCPCG